MGRASAAPGIHAAPDDGMSGTDRHRIRRPPDPVPDPQQRPVLLQYAGAARPAPRRWSERLALLAGGIAVLLVIGGATLTGAWAGFSLLGPPVAPARPAAWEATDVPRAEAAVPPPPPRDEPLTRVVPQREVTAGPPPRAVAPPDRLPDAVPGPPPAARPAPAAPRAGGRPDAGSATSGDRAADLPRRQPAPVAPGTAGTPQTPAAPQTPPAPEGPAVPPRPATPAAPAGPGKDDGQQNQDEGGTERRGGPKDHQPRGDGGDGPGRGGHHDTCPGDRCDPPRHGHHDHHGDHPDGHPRPPAPDSAVATAGTVPPA